MILFVNSIFKFFSLSFKNQTETKKHIHVQSKKKKAYLFENDN